MYYASGHDQIDGKHKITSLTLWQLQHHHKILTLSLIIPLLNSCWSRKDMWGSSGNQKTLPTWSTSATWWGSGGSWKGRWGELLWLDRTGSGWRGIAKSGVLENLSLWKSKTPTLSSHYVYFVHFSSLTSVSMIYILYHRSLDDRNHHGNIPVSRSMWAGFAGL